ncbi:MAG TPA: carboxypeptidase-like regulatory domain-containing protein [Thermoanaerobaculia bacterium]|nr:carboxypeptidase-like regulatory domain-containing protein [Thermoanaerobaculia bacterium]
MSNRKMILALFVSLFAVSAWAGAPLKGVDVKLGKNPGGSPAARTTSSDGKADFGVLPAGSYYVVADAPKSVAEEAQIEISGATEGTVKKRWNFAQKKAFGVDSTAREAGADKIVFTSDGKHPIDVAATAVVKSKSNISNN